MSLCPVFAGAQSTMNGSRGTVLVVVGLAAGLTLDNYALRRTSLALIDLKFKVFCCCSKEYKPLKDLGIYVAKFQE